MKIGIVGAGITGRLCSMELARRGHQVKLYERECSEKRNACSLKAAGLVAPGAELLTGGLTIGAKGLISLGLWELLCKSYPELQGAIQFHGALYLALPKSESLTKEFIRRCQDFPELMKGLHILEHQTQYECLAHSPRFFKGYYLEREACMNPETMFKRLDKILSDLKVQCFHNYQASRLHSNSIEFKDRSPEKGFDFIVDCRGLGSKSQLKGLRGVKGEMVQIKTYRPHLISVPIHFFHERWPIYMVPVDSCQVLVGATQIESEVNGGVTAGSMFDLLISALNLFPWLRDGDINRLVSGLRPAFQTNKPVIKNIDQIIYVNGLFRHGYLLGPLVAGNLARYIDHNLKEDLTLEAMQ